jgi:threonylcarbamoyladenosine tRNA methylthiotransferase MtaB
MSTASYYTLGCKLNFAETSAMGRALAQAAYTTVPFGQLADVVVINTCSVTDHADRKCKRVVREARASSPNAHVIVTGCYAQLKPTEVAAIPGVSLVLGAGEKFDIVSFLGQQGIRHTPTEQLTRFRPGYSLGERTRAFLKVQDGCDYTCAFCTIPQARGKSRSATVAESVAQAKILALEGVAEIVLTGVNIGDFGHSEAGLQREETFLDLVQTLDQLGEVERFRISSIEPNLLSDSVIDFVSTATRFAPHFHIPLQSGSDPILALMRRRYKANLYKARIARIRQAMPDASIGIDVIVGFPGETDAHFRETVALLEEINPAYLHVFTYSERANTHALTLSGTVPMHIRKERNAILTELSAKFTDTFYKEFAHTIQDVLWEAGTSETGMDGFTSNYIKVHTQYLPELTGSIERVQLTSLTNGVYNCIPAQFARLNQGINVSSPVLEA